MRQLKRARGTELRRRHGAHAIGIARKRVGGRPSDRLALVFYVEPGHEPAEAIPEEIEFTPADLDHPVRLATDVVETPQAEDEDG